MNDSVIVTTTRRCLESNMNKEIIFDPETWYSTTQIVQLARQGYAPFRSLSTLYSIINTGKIQVVARGTTKRKKYFIQGKDLVMFAESQKITINKDDKQM